VLKFLGNISQLFIAKSIARPHYNKTIILINKTEVPVPISKISTFLVLGVRKLFL